MDRELIGRFIDAAVLDQPAAERMLRDHPELREARWILEETVLHFLAVEGYAEAVRWLAERGFDVNAPNEFGDPPLIDVAVLGNDEIAATLLEFGADPNAPSEVRDNPLHCAVGSGNARLVDLLLRSGARADYVTDIGDTVVDGLPAGQRRRRAVLRVLREHGVATTEE